MKNWALFWTVANLFFTSGHSVNAQRRIRTLSFEIGVMDADRVTRWLSEKNAQNVAQPIFCQN
jgi:hypothetical protein